MAHNGLPYGDEVWLVELLCFLLVLPIIHVCFRLCHFHLHPNLPGHGKVFQACPR